MGRRSNSRTRSSASAARTARPGRPDRSDREHRQRPGRGHGLRPQEPRPRDGVTSSPRPPRRARTSRCWKKSTMPIIEPPPQLVQRGRQAGRRRGRVPHARPAAAARPSFASARTSRRKPQVPARQRLHHADEAAEPRHREPVQVHGCGHRPSRQQQRSHPVEPARRRRGSAGCSMAKCFWATRPTRRSNSLTICRPASSPS